MVYFLESSISKHHQYLLFNKKLKYRRLENNKTTSMAIEIFSVVSLLLDLVAAIWFAWPTISESNKQIKDETETRWGFNSALRESLLRSRKFTRIGLIFLALGSVFQLLAILYPISLQITVTPGLQMITIIAILLAVSLLAVAASRIRQVRSEKRF